jgi:hypothetical protein
MSAIKNTVPLVIVVALVQRPTPQPYDKLNPLLEVIDYDIEMNSCLVTLGSGTGWKLITGSVSPSVPRRSQPVAVRSIPGRAGRPRIGPRGAAGHSQP